MTEDIRNTEPGLTPEQKDRIDRLRTMIDLTEGALNDIDRADVDVKVAKDKIKQARKAVDKLNKIRNLNE